jgi:hypothetical protein
MVRRPAWKKPHRMLGLLELTIVKSFDREPCAATRSRKRKTTRKSERGIVEIILGAVNFQPPRI